MKKGFMWVWFISLLGVAWQVAAANKPPQSHQTSPTSYLPLIMKPVFDLSFDLVVTDLTLPTAITHAGDNRLFIAEKQGVIRIVQNGDLLEEPFLDISDRVNSSDIEQGITSVAFSPDFATSRIFYVLYTNLAGDVNLSRFYTSVTDPNRADPNSELILLDIDQEAPTHNGADMAFGPADGYLYIGVGDGGPFEDPHNMGQNRLTLKGKILRLNVTGVPSYTIPLDNPFVNDPTTLPEIWALGLRNPWRMSFDRLTHDLWITDVGENSWEEINLQPANSPGGENYGWRCYEGVAPFNLDGCADISVFTFPIYVYPHLPAGTCAITGGYRYRGTHYPIFYGDYFFADFCTGQLWTLKELNSQWQATRTPFTGLVSAFGEDVNGELYLTDYFGGKVYQIRPTNP